MRFGVILYFSIARSATAQKPLNIDHIAVQRSSHTIVEEMCVSQHPSLNKTMYIKGPFKPL